MTKRICIHHGKSFTRIYRVWSSMKHRCYGRNYYGYKNYGGRGIKVCDEWKNNFMSFYEWAIQNGYRKDAKIGECTIDRIDVNGNYEPSNCRWVSMKKQARNTRFNTIIDYNGEKLCLADASEKYNIPRYVISKRIKCGCSIKEAIEKKVKKPFIIIYEGKEYNLKELCKKLGLKYKQVHKKYSKGKSLEQIIGKNIKIIQFPNSKTMGYTDIPEDKWNKIFNKEEK